MNYCFFFLFSFLLVANSFQRKSKEYYDCINPKKNIFSPSQCTSIIIPEVEGYKCCSMKLTLEEKDAYNCFPLELEYSKSKENINEYLKSKNFGSFFGLTGSQIEIDCGEELNLIKNYPKLSDEYLRCSKGNIYMTNNESDCTDNDIPEEEGGKCCYIEKSFLNYNTEIKKDEGRCFVVKEKYFQEGKNFSDYLIEEANLKTLDDIINTNITISCKNYKKFFFQGKIIKPDKDINKESDHDADKESGEKSKKQKSKIQAWKIAIIVICSFIFFGFVAYLVVFLYRKKYNIQAESIEDKVNIEKKN